ncbi:T9SS type A sorting domain-containing protein [Chryseobacterium sp. SIMBA_038]|uniref:T9SS type A sorting domain-containing protein n=1 Tax=Chryseobacterium sp. SIMBA_038 TaxID=3085780 RepID=UPI003979ACC9
MSLPLIGFLCTSFVSAQCNALDSFSENFDTYASPNSIVPSCWERIALNGASQIISSTQPASGTSQIYQFGYGTGKVSLVILPKLTNVNKGTHRFRFKVKANSAGFLEFGYMTDPADASTFVVLENITITNTTYDSSSERIFTVPTSVPSTARLAVRNPGTSFAGHYWDDAVWEPISTNLGTHETVLNKVKTYPNPFHDIINISDIKDVQTITISDAVGRLIKTIQKPTATLQLGDLDSGIYFITLQYKDGKNTSFKAIKK